MPNVVTIDGLSPSERAFVEWFAQGLTQTQSATRAGYANPTSSGNDLMHRPEILTAIEAAKSAFHDIARVSREDIVEGLKEAIDMARTMADPLTMITGWRELAKVCGHYENKTKIEVNHTGNVQLEHLNQKSDAELLKLIEGERIE